MKVLFLIFHGFSNTSGISKKIQYQIKGMRECGHQVDVCTYTVDANNHRVRMINDKVIQDYGTGRLAAFRKRTDYSGLICYAQKHPYDIMYVRSFHNANSFTIHLFKCLRCMGTKIAMEIPTYPYDNEYIGFPLKEKIELLTDQFFRKKLAEHTNAIITFTEDQNIFGQRTICISNGIDFDSISLQKKMPHPTNEIHLTGVAEVHYWHGYDRLIAGLGQYYQKPHTKEVYFHIVGGIAPCEMHDSEHAPGFKELIDKYRIEGKVIFHGALYGEQLENVLNNTDFAIGSLARHRSGISAIKTLKNREYAARGIPFIYSETDSDFDDKPYILKAPADDSAINIESIIQFYENLNVSSEEIRTSIKNLSWKEQMKNVLNEL